MKEISYDVRVVIRLPDEADEPTNAEMAETVTVAVTRLMPEGCDVSARSERMDK